MGPRLAALGILAALLPACGISGGGTLTPTVAPGIPSPVLARGGNGSVMLDWAEVSQGAQYVVSRSLLSGGPFFPVSQPAGFQGSTRYVDSGLTNGRTYYYQVSAQNEMGQSPPSVAVKGSPGFKALQVSASCGGDGFGCLALLHDGTVWEWGVTPSGPEYTTPVQVGGLSDIVAISGGSGPALALRKDGTVWTWGDPATQIPGLSNVIAIGAGSFCLAVLSDGTVQAWGTNAEGELGTGSTTPSGASTPQPIPGLSDIVAVSAGYSHGLALRRDGLVFAWGDNVTGELGTGATSTTPGAVAQVPGLTGIVAVSAGFQFSLALKSDGTVWGWGSNLYGQLGIDDGRVYADSSTPVNLLVPTQMPVVAGGIAIAAGSSHSAVVQNDGSVWTCGYNYYGVLGNGTAGDYVLHPTPAQADVVHGAVQVTAGAGTTMARTADGTVWIWGDNFQGELGTGNGESVNKPTEIQNVTNASGIAGGNYFSVFSGGPQGTVFGVGEADVGELGDGGGIYGASSAPLYVSGPTGVTGLAAGWANSLAVTGTGQVWAWGINTYGQLGDGTAVGPKAAVLANTPTGILSVACGRDHCLAVRKDPVTGEQTAWAWGWNRYGMCGQGNPYNPSTTTPDPPLLTPSPVKNLTGVVSVAGGLYHSLAALSDGSVWAWGGNPSGELGQPDDVVGSAAGVYWTTLPMKVPGISTAVAVAAGSYFSLALLADGTVMAWGDGSDGELGNGGDAGGFGAPTGPTPLQVLNLTGIVAIAAGDSHALALKNDGTVWSWGLNSFGQLGNNTPGATGIPSQVQLITDVVKIAAGMTHSIAIRSNGTIWFWGQNQYGELGIWPIDSTATPIVLTR